MPWCVTWLVVRSLLPHPVGFIHNADIAVAAVHLRTILLL